MRKPARSPADNIGRTGAWLTVVAASVLGVLLLTAPDNIGAFMAGLLAATTVVVAPPVTMTTLMVQSRHRRHPAKGPRDELDSAHLVLLVLSIAVLIDLVLLAFK